jgi:hypothetical protein
MQRCRPHSAHAFAGKLLLALWLALLTPLSQVYAAFLLLLSPISSLICRHLNYHAAFVQIVALLVFGNRQVVPIAQGETPADKEFEYLILLLIVLLACTGFLGPGCMPRYQSFVPGQEVSVSKV